MGFGWKPFALGIVYRRNKGTSLFILKKRKQLSMVWENVDSPYSVIDGVRD